MSDVAVIVLDLDGGPMLQRCIDSIAAQTLRPSRVIVLDNGSRESVTGRLRGDVEIIRSETNLGFAGGVNAAYERVREPYVALVNNDVELDADWLAIVAAALDADARLAAAQTVIRRDERTIDGAGIDISDGTFRQIGHGQPLGTKLQAAWGVSATATLYRAAAVGPRFFDARFFAYYEDVELCARLHAAGWRTEVLPVARALHHGSASASLLGGMEARRLRTRNRYWVARMHPGVGRRGALLWEDFKLLLQGRSSLAGIWEGLMR
jgi:GT2 family glycosyltransferase